MKLAANTSPFMTFCSGINSSTKLWYLNGFAYESPYDFYIGNITTFNSQIAMICVESTGNGIPETLEEQKIYYLKKYANPGGYVTGFKCFQNLTDAKSDINHLAPSFSKTFRILFVNKVDSKFECAEFGKDDPLDYLVCCPKLQYFKDFYDTVLLTVAGGNQLVMKRTGNGLYGTASGPGIPYFELTAPTIYRGDFVFGNSIYGKHELILRCTVYLNGQPYQSIGAIYESSVSSSMTWQMNMVNPLSNYFPTNFFTQHFETLFPSTITVSLDPTSKSILPATLRLSMPDAYFHDPDRPVTIGNINETLTLDQKSGYYISEKKNYYNIPGRLHLRPKFWPLADSDIRFVNNGGGALLANHYQPTNRIIDMQGTFYYEKINPYSGGGLQLFVAVDEFDGYATGLARGTVWMDSRVDINQIGVQHTDTSIFVVGYSRVLLGSGDGTILHNSFYKTNYFSVRSKHPKCYFTSLQV